MTLLRVSDLLARKGKALQLEVLTGDVGLDRSIRVPQVSSPGLVLAGFTKRFPAKRLHVLGETEVDYLRSLSPDARRASWETFLNFDLPCIFVTKGLRVPPRCEATCLTHWKGVLVAHAQPAEYCG